MKPFLILPFVFTAMACKQRHASSDLTNDDSKTILKYSVYSWYDSSGQWAFYLHYYMGIKKNGEFDMIFRDSLMNRPKYFIGLINDSIMHQIEQILRIDTFKTDYKHDVLFNMAYDGYTYCLDLINKNKKVVFIQDEGPACIKKLSMLLDSACVNSKCREVDTVTASGYIAALKRYAAAQLGQHPKIEKTKFIPPKVSK
jgi:hypothetical protein